MSEYSINTFYEMYVLSGMLQHDELFDLAKATLVPSDFTHYRPVFEEAIKQDNASDGYEASLASKNQDCVQRMYQINFGIKGFSNDTCIDYMNKLIACRESSEPEPEPAKPEEPKQAPKDIHAGDRPNSKQCIERQFAEMEKGFVKTGFPILDANLKMSAGYVIVLAANTSVGKSSLSLIWAANAALDGKKVLYLTQGEMRNLDTDKRLCSMFSGVSQDALIECPDAFEILDTLSSSFYRTDKKMSVADIKQYCKEEKEATGKGFDLIVVDYLNIVPAGDLRMERHQVLGQIMTEFSAFAKQEDIVFLVNCQMQRETNQNEGVNSLYRIQESSKIETSADAVLILSRKLGSSEASLYIAKSRHGTCAVTIPLRFDGRTTKYSEGKNY